ncbi:MAG: hypothetical protein Q4F84_09405 [Fibrobacter sp.]|nr:hypothetical protein [Fibrobacter sp.]
MIQKKSKCSDYIRRVFYTLLGQKRFRKLLAFSLKSRYKSSSVCFPVNIEQVKEILIILPEERLEVLHQLKNVISLVKHFKHATVTIVCERSASSYIKMIPGLNVIEYEFQENVAIPVLLVKEVKKLNHIDICFLLHNNPSLPLRYLAGVSEADTRVGYDGAGGFPFLNLQIRPDTTKRYFADWNCSIAKLFGALPDEIHWSVAQKTIDEVNHLLKELNIEKKSYLVGLDIVFLLNHFGNSWTETLVNNIAQLELGQLYFYVSENPSVSCVEWIQKQKVPFIGDLSASRTAALVSRSNLIISGNTPIYALAGLLKKHAIGFFKEDEIEMYCPQTSTLMGISYKTATEEIIAQTMSLIANHNKKRKT